MTERPESDDRRPTPVPAPPARGPVPAPRPAPAPKPAAVPPPPAAAARPAPAQPEALARAQRYGRAAADGTVYVTVAGVETECGQYPDATPDEALGYFARKFDDAAAQVTLLEQRLAAKAPTGEMRRTVAHVREQLEARAMVGDLAGLAERLDALDTALSEAQEREKDEQRRARAEQLAYRTGIVEAAEKVAEQDPAKTQWKHSSARMAELFEQWKTHQRSGVRLSKSDEEALWKRFRKARTTFDRHRKAFFSKLDETNAKAKRAKEELIGQAEALSGSTDWAATAARYRELMDRWKAAPRASRKEDDALWARFRAAQDVFFAARHEANERVDREFEANLAVKEQLLREARAILPVTDLQDAKARLASVQERWEQAGKVPRADMRRIENELRSVEDTVQRAENERWRRTDPETKARSDSMLTQLEQKIAEQQDALEAARGAGDERRAAGLENDLATSRQWLETLRRSASELG